MLNCKEDKNNITVNTLKGTIPEFIKNNSKDLIVPKLLKIENASLREGGKDKKRG